MTTYVVVTGTGTGVGKTVVTAALAAILAPDVAVVKPVQTGTGSDIQEVARLSGVTDVHELVRLAEPLAPETAARRAGITLPPVADLAERVAAFAAPRVLVEGAGGVRVRLDSDGGTVLGLALALRSYGAVEVVVVTRAGLGTLNATELTVDAVRSVGLPLSGLVIGAWPVHPDLAATCNRDDLPRLTGVPLLGVVPEGCGGWQRDAFRTSAPGWLSGYAAPP